MQLEEVFSSILGVPTSELDDATSPAVVSSWTSRGHIELITAMESLYGVTFTTEEIKSLKSLGDARGFLRNKGVVLEGIAGHGS